MMTRREFITLVGSAAAWPLTTRAQQVVPVIGLLSSVGFETRQDQLAAFHRGLNESGYVERQNLMIEYRSADNQVERLPDLAADLARRQVAVIVTIGGDITIRAAKAATTTIPIVFVSGDDPVRNGFVANLNRPGGNLTGVSFLVNLMVAKHLEFLSELAPAATTIGVLVNPDNPNAERNTTDVRSAAAALTRKLVVAKASTEREIDAAFASFVREKVDAILVEPDPFLLVRREQIVALAGRHALAAIYAFREFAIAGGLMSYGANLGLAYHQVGIYAGKILKGDKAADLPVVQPTKFELVINLKTAKTLGLKVPLTLQVAADEVIE
jgi:putative ABC transport system substrate-binding protein